MVVDKTADGSVAVGNKETMFLSTLPLRHLRESTRPESPSPRVQDGEEKQAMNLHQTPQDGDQKQAMSLHLTPQGGGNGWLNCNH